MATSGTIGQTIFTNQQLIDHAFRRCKMVEQEITGEHLEIALEMLWLFCMTLVNKGIKLWNIDPIILPIYAGEYTVPMPLGTEDILNVNLRTQTRLSTGTPTASEGVAANAFDGDLTTSCTQALAAGNIQLQLDTATAATTFGILVNALPSASPWTFVIEGSNDAITYTTLIDRSAAGTSVVAGEWVWFDIQNANAFQYYRLRATGTTILDVTEFVIQLRPSEIPFYFTLNRNDYSNLPDKTILGRPTQCWYDRQRRITEIEIWPAPQEQFTFAQITGYVQRQMQDVGSMTQELEVPDRWYLAIVCVLAAQMGREIKEVDEALIPRLDMDAKMYLDDAWAGEGDGSDTYWRPNIRPYTR